MWPLKLANLCFPGYSKIPYHEPVTNYKLQSASSNRCEGGSSPRQRMTEANTGANSYPCCHSYSCQSPPMSSFSTFSPQHLYREDPTFSARISQKDHRPNFACQDFVQSTPSAHCTLPRIAGYLTSPVYHGDSPHFVIPSARSVRSPGCRDDGSFASGGGPTSQRGFGGHRNGQFGGKGIQRFDYGRAVTDDAAGTPGRLHSLSNSTFDSDCTGVQYSCTDLSAALNEMRTPMSHGFQATGKNNNTTDDSESSAIDPVDLCQQIDDIFFRDKMSFGFARPR